MTSPNPPESPEPQPQERQAHGSQNHTLRFAARTDAGLLRSNNEDSYTIGARLLAVADGMGGHAAGEVASRMVTDALAPLNSAPLSTDVITALGEAVRTGNRSIAQLVTRHPELEGMGTTVTALLFDGDHVALAHIGDSRGYLYRSGVLQQLTHDDTFVQSLVDEGRITEQQAHEHPQRNLVLRALTGIEVEPLLTARETTAGDRFLLCSDGLCGVVGAEAIADALSCRDPEAAADALIDLALAAGGPDNITVVVVDVLSTGGGTQDTAPMAALPPEDPSATSPIAQLTREMPRVPLPPIPEEPGAVAEIVDDDADLDDDEEDADEDDEDDAADDATQDQDGTATADRRTRAPSRRGTGKRRWYRRGAVLITALVLLAGAIVASTLWVRTQYYVSDQGNLVVVFRGVDGSLLGWSFSTFEETSCAGETDCTPLKVSDLQPAARYKVQAGIKAASLADARTLVQRLSEQLLPPCPEDLPAATTSDAAPASSTRESTTESTTHPGITGAPSTRSPGPTSTAEPTDLLPVTQVPGVTCRTVT